MMRLSLLFGAICLLLLAGCSTKADRTASADTLIPASVAGSYPRGAPLQTYADLLDWVSETAGVEAVQQVMKDQPHLTEWAAVRALSTGSRSSPALIGQVVPRLTNADQMSLRKRWNRWYSATLRVTDSAPMPKNLRQHAQILLFDDHVMALGTVVGGTAGSAQTDLTGSSTGESTSVLARLAKKECGWSALDNDPIVLLDALRLADDGLLPEPPDRSALIGAQWLGDLGQPLAALTWAQRAARSLPDAELLRVELLLDLHRSIEARDTAIALADGWRGHDDPRAASALALAACAAWQRGQISACDALLDSAVRQIGTEPVSEMLRQVQRVRLLATRSSGGKSVTPAELLGTDPAQAKLRQWTQAGRLFRHWLSNGR